MFTDSHPARRLFFLIAMAMGAMGLLQPLHAQEKLLHTVAPADLLKAFPAAPPEWKRLESKAQTILSVTGTPNTTAIRRYELPPPEPEAAARLNPATEEIPPPPLIRIIALDRGSRQSATLAVEPPDKARPENRWFQIGALKGRFRKYTARFLFESDPDRRLVIQIEGRHVDEHQFRQIIARLDWSPLLKLEERLPTGLVPVRRDVIIENNREIPIWVYEVENERIDEMNPKRNRKWKSAQYSR